MKDNPQMAGTVASCSWNEPKKPAAFPKRKRKPEHLKLIERSLRAAGKAIQAALELIADLKRGD